MDSDFYHRPAKRSKFSHSSPDYYYPQYHHPPPVSSAALVQHIPEDPPRPSANFWVDSSLYALDPVQNTPPSIPESSDWILDQDAQETGYEYQNDPGIQSWLSEQMPYLFTVDLPLLEERKVDLGIANPFDDNTLVRFSDKDREKKVVPVDGAINSYIKFRIRQATDVSPPEPPRIGHRRLSMSSNASQPRNSNLPPAIVPYLPPNFGKKWNLDETDKKLLRFYLVAFCNGRTLLPKTNAYLDLAPIAESDEGVKHALLSLAAGYVLDYVPTPQLQERANYHYRRAIEFLTTSLRESDTHAVGKGDAAVAALILLFTDDTVQWELTTVPKGPDAVPRWLAGAKVARTILDNTDEGYRYWNPVNVQITDARHSNSNMIAYFNIIAEPITPLKASHTDRMYSWLLEGTSREVRKIHGTSSLSPKLLHTFAQITHLSVKMADNPESTVLPHGAKRIETRLKAFRQWSDLSQGYPSVEALFSACILDADGKVNSAAMVTDLTAQTYVQTALLYLYCRFFRYPRSHPKVIQALEIACGCLDRMPYNGPLFTAQSPFFPIVLMGLISCRPQDRRSLYDWFNAVLTDAGARSSVPPVWKTLQRMWTWLDEEMTNDNDTFDESRPIGQRYAWWEVMVERLVAKEGVLCLA